MEQNFDTVEYISDILFSDWDPIGVKKIVGPARYEKNKGEYRKYAREIVIQFSNEPKEDAIFAYLKVVCQKRIGLGLNKVEWQDTKDVAQKISIFLLESQHQERDP